MEYAIFAVDDSRKAYTDTIRARLGGSFWFNETEVWTVNGNDEDQLDRASDRHKYRIRWQHEGGPRRGHLGIWYTVLNALDYTIRQKSIVTFEDDALLHPQFENLFWQVTAKLPRDTDAFALFLPRDQDDVYRKNASKLNVSLGMCRAYQRYGGVSMLWTPRGAAKFRTLLRRDGITDQWDNQLYGYARNGEMNVYTQTPHAQILVSITGRETSIVQESSFL